jgi:TRAP-type mannitol/chloroaromatic compound transport system substrate-binding protein
MEILQDFNFAAFTPYATETNLFVVTFAVVMNKEKWNSLPADVKKVLDDLRREQAEWTGKYVDDHVDEAIKWSKDKYKLQIIKLPASEMAEIPKLTKPMIDDYIKRMNAKGLPGDKIIKGRVPAEGQIREAVQSQIETNRAGAVIHGPGLFEPIHIVYSILAVRIGVKRIYEVPGHGQ